MAEVNEKLSLVAFCAPHGVESGDAEKLHAAGLKLDTAHKALSYGLSPLDILSLFTKYGPMALEIVQFILDKFKTK